MTAAGADAETRHPRVGRQVAGDHLRRRGVRAGDARRAVRRLPESGRGLLRRRAASSSNVHLSARRRGAGRTRARPFASGPGLDRDTRMGPLVSAEHFERVRLSGYRQARRPAGARRQSRDGRRARRRLFRRADDLLRRRSGRRDRARRDLRARSRASCRSTTRKTPSAWQTTRCSAWRRRSGRATSSARCGSCKRLRTGIIWVNHSQPAAIEAPWGGFKQSGIGRELGRWGVESYLETKQVYLNADESAIGWPET